MTIYFIYFSLFFFIFFIFHNQTTLKKEKEEYGYFQWTQKDFFTN